MERRRHSSSMGGMEISLSNRSFFHINEIIFFLSPRFPWNLIFRIDANEIIFRSAMALEPESCEWSSNIGMGKRADRNRKNWYFMQRVSHSLLGSGENLWNGSRLADVLCVIKGWSTSELSTLLTRAKKHFFTVYSGTRFAVFNIQTVEWIMIVYC